jgi:hypothetical protein
MCGQWWSSFRVKEDATVLIRKVDQVSCRFLSIRRPCRKIQDPLGGHSALDLPSGPVLHVSG